MARLSPKMKQIIEVVTEADSPMTTQQIAEKTGGTASGVGLTCAALARKDLLQKEGKAYTLFSGDASEQESEPVQDNSDSAPIEETPEEINSEEEDGSAEDAPEPEKASPTNPVAGNEDGLTAASGDVVAKFPLVDGKGIPISTCRAVHIVASSDVEAKAPEVDLTVMSGFQRNGQTYYLAWDINSALERAAKKG